MNIWINFRVHIDWGDPKATRDNKSVKEWICLERAAKIVAMLELFAHFLTLFAFIAYSNSVARVE